MIARSRFRFRRLRLVALIAFASLFVGSSSLAQTLPDTVVNPGFEQGAPGEPPTGWQMPTASVRAGFSARLVTGGRRSGKQSVLVSGDARNDGAGVLLQALDATPFRGKKVRLRASVRVGAEPVGMRAQLFLRVDRENDQAGFFDNMADRPIQRTTWRDYDIVGEVAPDARFIVLGLIVPRPGQVWLDNVSLTAIGSAATVQPPRPLTARGLENLVAFTKLLGYVRHFHPSDAASQTDWDQFAIRGVRSIEGANDPADLARRLTAFFAPIAPTVQVWPTTGPRPALPPAQLQPPTTTKYPLVVAWEHLGVALGGSVGGGVYESHRDRRSAMNGTVLPGRPDPRTFLHEVDLGGGVRGRVPLAVWADGLGTLPRTKPVIERKADRVPESGDDRATRLADIALAWNVFQHFYPYFDIARPDWPAALRASLTKAATDGGERPFLDTLRRLVGWLGDGHGRVAHDSDARGFLPGFWAGTVENKLVVLSVYRDDTRPRDLKIGDVITKIDGRDVNDVLAEQGELVSAASPQWRRERSVEDLLLGAEYAQTTFTFERPGEPPFTMTLSRQTAAENVFKSATRTEPRPATVIAEIKPGLFYTDLDRVTDAEFRAALPTLAKAKGLIFDLRGYPRQIRWSLLGHLSDKPLASEPFLIPTPKRPDRLGMTWQKAGWEIPPEKPRLTAPAAFLTDGRAISQSEVWLGIVAHYKLATIVGTASAGTNGNINPFRLPGGYTVIWTGMKVLNYDNSRFHGVGIPPNVRAERTIDGIRAGRDEVLERAIAVVEGKTP